MKVHSMKPWFKGARRNMSSLWIRSSISIKKRLVREKGEG
jgi:hypothetical protein